MREFLYFFYSSYLTLCVIKNVATSRFPFQPPFQCSSKSFPDYDNDGDVIVERRQQYLFVIGTLIPSVSCDVT